MNNEMIALKVKTNKCVWIGRNSYRYVLSSYMSFSGIIIIFCLQKKGFRIYISEKPPTFRRIAEILFLIYGYERKNADKMPSSIKGTETRTSTLTHERSTSASQSQQMILIEFCMLLCYFCFVSSLCLSFVL